MTEKATFAGGCFWCADAVFRMLKGVKSVVSGYTGGSEDAENSSYEKVAGGKTGHVEAIQVEYDPEEVSYEDLLEVFWTSHNPTQVGGQGADIGTQYEAAIFYHDDIQKDLAEKSKRALDLAKVYDKPIVTRILPFKKFFVAEDYHQDYYSIHKDAPYCQIVIEPKIEKVKKLFSKKLKDESR